MMDDRQLLEAAAKAAVYTLGGHTQKSNAFCLGGIEWNPLTDDGDALRLAVKLGITFRKLGHIVTAVGKTQCDEYIDADPYAATRRAIVRAAAEMGK